MSLVVPKILGVEEFAYWQLFLLYISYVALFHLGLNDGVYLVNGGKTYDEMDRGSSRASFLQVLSSRRLWAPAYLLYRCLP